MRAACDRVGVIGETGHGKSTLVAAISRAHALMTGARSRSYSELTAGGERVDHWFTRTVHPTELECRHGGTDQIFVDLPGDPTKLAAVAPSAMRFTGLIAVVSLTEGCSSALARQLKAVRGLTTPPELVLFLNKNECVDVEERIREVEAQARAVSSWAGFAGESARLFRGSALQAANSRSASDPGARLVLQLLAAFGATVSTPAPVEAEQRYDHEP